MPFLLLLGPDVHGGLTIEIPRLVDPDSGDAVRLEIPRLVDPEFASPRARWPVTDAQVTLHVLHMITSASRAGCA